MAIWTIRTHYKKSCEQHEHFYHRNLDGAKVIVKDGYRSAEFNIFTSDDNFPAIEFTEVPGGDGKKDSVDLFSLMGENIDSTDLIEMYDGGCWGDIKIEGVDDEDEVERLHELINEEGSYALEDDGDGDWYLSDTECWVWGPLEIEDQAGNVRIIIANEDGNVVDFDTNE
jgi:hypothetical protein